ncbi:unnamed protein product [Urochloa decumbens]|uniref:Uncharacterized protein n=1 Tax=Urochloa decumbens TaxID=240449 RepID=A0ABC8Z5I0_9POAL
MEVRRTCCGLEGVDVRLREPYVHVLHGDRVLPHIQQVDGPEYAADADAAAVVRRGVRPAAAVSKARQPALVQRHPGVHRRVRCLRQLHPVHHPEPVIAAGAAAAQAGAPDAPPGPVPLAPLLRRSRHEPREAAADRVSVRVAVPERAALGVVVALVRRVVPEAAPRAVVEREPLQLRRRRAAVDDDEAGEQRRVADEVAVVGLVGAVHDAERERLRLEVGNAREDVPVPRPARVDTFRASHEEELREPADDELERDVAGGRVGGVAPGRDVPGDAVPGVHAQLHAREQRVRRVVEALPRHAVLGVGAAAVAVGAEDEVAGVQELRGGARGDVAAGGWCGGGPDGDVVAVEDGEAAAGGEVERGRGGEHGVLAVGDPDDGRRAWDAGVPDAEVGSAVGGAVRGEEAERVDAAGRDERLVAGQRRVPVDGVGGCRGGDGGEEEEKGRYRARRHPLPRFPNGGASRTSR